MTEERKREEGEVEAKTGEEGGRKAQKGAEEATSGTVEGDPARRGGRARSKESAGLSPGQEVVPTVRGANILIPAREQGVRARRGREGALLKREAREGVLPKTGGVREALVQGGRAATTHWRAGAGGAGARRRSRRRRSVDTGSRIPAALEQSAEDYMNHPGEESGGRRSQGAIRSQGVPRSQGAIGRERKAMIRIFSSPLRAE